MEQKILSPIDGNTDYCFESLDERNGVTSYLDYKTGFTSNSTLKAESDTVKKAEANQPKLVTELSVLDSLRNIVWYPSVINIPLKGMVFPMGTKDNWSWEVMKVLKRREKNIRSLIKKVNFLKRFLMLKERKIMTKIILWKH